MEVSKLNVYSLGTVAVNKPLSSKEIEVVPIEDSPMLDGELTDNASMYKSEASDEDGRAYQIETASSATVKATWLPLGMSNRMTAPDVRRGATVVLYRFGDVDKFYWATLTDDMHLRKLETVVFAFSGTADEGAQTTAENSYYFEVSTHKKIIHLHTSRANGEPFSYDIQINAGEGFLQIQDDAKNSFLIDSAQRHVELINGDGSKFELLKKEINITSLEKVTINTKILTSTALTMLLNGAITATGNMVQKGIYTLMGKMNIAVGSGGDGSITTAGPIKTTDNISSDGTIAGQKVTSVENIVAPNV